MRTGSRGLRRRIWILAALALGISLLGSAPALAHGELERSEPPNGGTVEVGRSTITLWFSEPISAEASSFDLHTLDGIRAAVTPASSMSDSGGFVELQTGPLLKATYRLDFAVLSLVDGHVARGSVLFGVGVRPVVQASSGSGLPDTPALALRWLDLSMLMLAIGAVAVSGGVLRSLGKAGRAARRRARTIGIYSAAVGLVVGIVTPFMRVPRGDSPLPIWLEATRSTLAGTEWGRLWTARVIGLGLLTFLMWTWRTRGDTSGRTIRAVVGICALGIVWLESAAGHGAVLPRQAGLATTVAAAHLAAAGVWVGGLAVTAICVAPLVRRSDDARGPVLASAWRRFSPMAAVAAIVLLATGLYESGRHIPGLASMSSTIYGISATVKGLALMGALGFAALNTLLINPELAAPIARLIGRAPGWSPLSLKRFSTVVALELLVLGAAVGTAAVLTSVPTAREVEAAAQETSVHSANVAGVFMTFEEVPAGAGRSRLIVRTRSVVRPEPGPIVGATVGLDGPDGFARDFSLSEIEAGRYEVETERLVPGAWDATVAVHRESLDDAVSRFSWDIPAPIPQGARPFEIVATVLALLTLLGGVGVVRVIIKRKPSVADITVVPLADPVGTR